MQSQEGKRFDFLDKNKLPNLVIDPIITGEIPKAVVLNQCHSTDRILDPNHKLACKERVMPYILTWDDDKQWLDIKKHSPILREVSGKASLCLRQGRVKPTDFSWIYEPIPLKNVVEAKVDKYLDSQLDRH